MKKRLFVIVTVLSLMLAAVGSASAAPKETVTFMGGVWTKGGLVFTFQVDEKPGDRWINGRVEWADGTQSMSCSYDDGYVRCNAPRGLANKNLTVTVLGSSFKAFVKSRQFCYPAYDWPPGGDPTDPADWGQFATHCQDEPASFYDTEPVTIYNEWYGASFKYWYWFENCFGDSLGDGYYFDCWYFK